MTFDEFNALALNPPRYEGVTICRLDVYCYADEWEDMSGTASRIPRLLLNLYRSRQLNVASLRISQGRGF